MTRPLPSWRSLLFVPVISERFLAKAHERGADEALLLNTNGEVAETAGGNIFWVYQNSICTVPTGRGVLPGGLGGLGVLVRHGALLRLA